MVTPLEVGLLVLVLALLFGAYRVIKAVKPFVVNAVVGVVILAVASFLGLGVKISVVTVLITAVGGIPGAILVLLLAYFDVAFVATLAPLGVLA